MEKQYHFCFVFTRLTILNEPPSPFDSPSHFKIYLLLSPGPGELGRFLGETRSIARGGEGKGGLRMREEIRCSLGEETVHFPSILSLQLTELKNGGEQHIGTYQFAAGNYAHISDSLNRHCIQLTVQIAQNHALHYEVFVDTSREGVEQIRREHSKARLRKRSRDLEDFPEEPIPPRHRPRLVRLDSDDFIVSSQRYWSPTSLQAHPSPQRKRRTLLKKESYNEGSFTRCEHEASFSQASKREEVTVDDAEERALSEDNKGGSMILEPEIESVSAEEEDEEKTMEQVYEVIRSNSRVIGSEDTKEPPPPEAKPQPPLLRHYSRGAIAAYTKQAGLFVLLVLLLAVMVSWMSVLSGRHSRQYTLFA